MLTKIKKSADYIQSQIDIIPKVGIILGTGLGGLSKNINKKVEIPYKSIPNFPVSSVQGHKGSLILGMLAGVNVIAMQGRFHYYEGLTMQEITFPIRVMKMLGIEYLIVSNASGGLNPNFNVGDIMIITDHINLMGNHPLIGDNDETLGTRFPDMSNAYDNALILKASEIANRNNIDIKKGIYAAVSGPTYETPAEYNYIRVIGADAVGMSTVPEVIVARHASITVFAVSIISDLGVPGKIENINHQMVIDAAIKTEPKMTTIITELLKDLN